MLKTCPVLAFDAEVREWLWWFERCYSVRVVGMGSAMCVREDWPASGSVGDQDARTVLALEYAAGVLNQVLTEQAEIRKSRQEADRQRKRR